MHVFLLPAILGDEPQLVDLRHALTGSVDFDLLDLPDLDRPVDTLCSMELTAGILAEEIGRRQPTGAVALAGFSYGASLALAVAAHLNRAGRTIGFLVVLDGAFGTSELRRSNAELLRLCLSMRGLASLGMRLVERLNNRRNLFLAARFAKGTAVSSPALRDALLTDYRCRALNSWQPTECEAPGLLVVSGTLGDVNRNRWMALGPNLTIMDVAAKHGTFLTGASLDQIARRFSAEATRVDARRVPAPISRLPGTW